MMFPDNHYPAGKPDFTLLAPYGLPRRYRAGCLIAFEGDDADALYLVRSGYVKIFSSEMNGMEIIYRIEGPGSLFGELSLIDGRPRSASVAALSDCELVYLSRSRARLVAREQPELSAMMFVLLASRIRQLSGRVASHVSGSVYQRLKVFLEEMEDHYRSGYAEPLPLKHRELGGLVGASREMVTKLVNGLKRRGYIRMENRVIRVIRALPSRFPGEK
ncbi:MAG TPA: Crp/Fnr family transcriptional regulator [Gammaproteobacteria bacterium]|nr:Crp/Fnr family transcriptional regulator [Gammaproteobacteria bacterium]